MARTYLEFVQGLTYDQLRVLELSKRRELAYEGSEKSAAWRAARQDELRSVRAELKLRGEQLELLS
jgi:hypothetical protein